MVSGWAIGHLTLEDIVLPDGTTSMSTMGGNVLYSVVGAAVAGNQMGIVTRIGCDYPSDSLSDLEKYSIQLELKRVSAKCIRQWCLYEPDGSRTFLLHSASGSHDEVSPLPQEGPQSDRISGIHVAPMPVKYQRKWVEFATDLKVPISLDPHHDACAAEPDSVWQLLSKLFVFAPSELEVGLLYGPDLEAAAHAFVEAGASTVIIKMGADGSLLATRDELHHVPAYPIDVRDSTGAGDSFCGALLSSLLEGYEPLFSAYRATVAASIVIEHFGVLTPLQVIPNCFEDRMSYFKNEVAKRTKRQQTSGGKTS